LCVSAMGLEEKKGPELETNREKKTTLRRSKNMKKCKQNYKGFGKIKKKDGRWKFRRR